MVRSASLLPSRDSNISQFRFGKNRSVRLFRLGNWKFRVRKWARILVSEKASATGKSHTAVLKENGRADNSLQ